MYTCRYAHDMVRAAGIVIVLRYCDNYIFVLPVMTAEVTNRVAMRLTYVCMYISNATGMQLL